MKVKKILNFYQKAMWYAGVTRVEISKPLGFVNEYLVLLTFLTVSVGVKTGVWATIVLYAIILILAIGVGKLIAKLGIVAYTTKLGNRHNPEITELLKTVKRLERKINKLGKQ